jgi:hypothetical protein
MLQESSETKIETSSGETDSNAKNEPTVPAEPPKVNIWDARKKEMASRGADKPPVPATGNAKC